MASDQDDGTGFPTTDYVGDERFLAADDGLSGIGAAMAALAGGGCDDCGDGDPTLDGLDLADMLTTLTVMLRATWELVDDHYLTGIDRDPRLLVYAGDIPLDPAQRAAVARTLVSLGETLGPITVNPRL